MRVGVKPAVPLQCYIVCDANKMPARSVPRNTREFESDILAGLLPSPQ
jgi:hypothetical protein